MTGHTETTGLPPVKMTEACSWEQEQSCTASVQWDDGAPYCDRCGIYRRTIHHQERKS